MADNKSLIKKMQDRTILVLGDLILDHYIWGEVKRISPEAPVPIVKVEREEFRPGGAANTCANIVSLGARAILCGILGDDEAGRQSLAKYTEQGIDTSAIIKDSDRPTIQKTRIIAKTQQLVRVDREKSEPYPSETAGQILRILEEKLPEADAVIISDYGKGIVSRSILNRLIPLALNRKKIITVDPKPENLLHYKKVTSLTPNHFEASQSVHLPCGTDEETEKTGLKILKKLNAPSLLITRGEKGMTLFTREKITHIPTQAQEVFDVTGAGDTVISVFTLALAAKAGFLQAARIANAAAGIVVGKIGAAQVTVSELNSIL